MTDSTIDANVTALQRGQSARAAKAAIEAELPALQAAIDEDVFRKIRAGEAIDPQYAVQQWMAKFTLADMPRRLGRTERMGQAASKRLEPKMRA